MRVECKHLTGKKRKQMSEAETRDHQLQTHQVTSEPWSTSLSLRRSRRRRPRDGAGRAMVVSTLVVPREMPLPSLDVCGLELTRRTIEPQQYPRSHPLSLPN